VNIIRLRNEKIMDSNLIAMKRKKKENG
jgi:hypothetical protein